MDIQAMIEPKSFLKSSKFVENKGLKGKTSSLTRSCSSSLNFFIAIFFIATAASAASEGA